MQELLMPFIDQSPSYVYGFEAAQIWDRMWRGEVLTNYIFHAQNAEQINLMASHFGYDFEITDYDGDWAWLNGSPKFDVKQN